MINLMKADLYRIFKGIGIYIAIAMVIIMSSVSIAMKEAGYIGNASVENYNATAVKTEEGSYEYSIEIDENATETTDKKELVRSIYAANTNLYYPLIIVVFVILMSDFSNKTLKNTLTSAVSKKKYFLYKLLMTLGCSAIFTIFSNLFVYLLNFIVNGKAYTDSFGNIAKATVLQLPMIIGITAFLVFVGFLTRRTAVYNAVAIPFVMLFQIICFALYRLMKSEILLKFLEKYEFQSALNKLAFLPESGFCLQCIGIGVLEIAVFSLLSWLIFKKSEVK